MLKIYPSKLQGYLTAPPSKEYAQRLLFASALTNTPTIVHNVPDCVDVDITLTVLRTFGCRVEQNGGDVTVIPFSRNNPLNVFNFNFGNSSLTSCIAIALVAAFGYKASCKGSKELTKRSLFPLTSRMSLRGVNFTSFSIPMDMGGLLESGDFVMSGDEGNQFISALMFALPLLRGDSRIQLSSPLKNRCFVDITVDMLKIFGIKIEEKGDTFYIPGGQIYTSPGEAFAENDWLLANFWVLAGTLSKGYTPGVSVGGLNGNSHQRKLDLTYLFSLIRHDCYFLNIDANAFPDIATILMAASIVKGGGVEIKNVPMIKNSEVNRFKYMKELVEGLGGSVECTDTDILIRAPKDGVPDSYVIDTKGDPWIFMSFVCSSNVMKKPLLIKNPHDGDKIYRGFLDDFTAVGGIYEII